MIHWLKDLPQNDADHQLLHVAWPGTAFPLGLWKEGVQGMRLWSVGDQRWEEQADDYMAE